MKRGRAAVAILTSMLAGTSYGADELSLSGMVDLRWISANGQTSYLNGGEGVLRFDSDHDGLRVGRAFLAPSLRVSDIVTLHAVVDSYADHDRSPIDLSEAWIDIRPFPANSLRWQARIGAFHMPVSLENRGTGWTDVYSITPSAINTWMGEEFRTIGAEVSARWLGAASGYLGDISVVAATYAWNDPAGELLAVRGFAMTDRPSTLFGGLGQPPITFYHEIDHNPGYYAGLTWRHHDRLEIRALRYDNLADPGASTRAGGNAWLTQFWSLGARLESIAHWTFIAQDLDGNTAVGSNDEAYEQFRMRYQAAFALASFDWTEERFSMRFDRFETHQTSFLNGPATDESGHAWTAAWSHQLGDHWQAVAEWIHVTSRFPPRAELGVAPGLLETQFQLAIRYRFKYQL
jgi:hypothetical protein